MFTQLKSNMYSSEEKSRMGFSGGADLIFFFKNTGKLKMGLSLGVGYSLYNSKRSLNYNDSAWTTDVGGDQVHVYEQGNITEKQTTAYFNIPIQLHFNYLISEKISIYMNAGYFLSFGSSGNYTSDAVLSRQGYYPRYNALIYDVDVEGAQYFYPTNKSLTNKESLKLKNSSGITASFGMKYMLSPKFSAFAGVKTCFGLSSISGYNSEVITIANNNRNLNTLMSRGDKIKANAYGIEVGLSVNIGRCKKKTAIVKEMPVTETKEETPIVKEDSTQQIVVADTIREMVTIEENKTVIAAMAEKKQDTIKSTPMIEGKDDITTVPGPIVLAFTNENKEIVNRPVNYNPRQVYTLEEINRLIQQGVPISKKHMVLQRIEFEFNTDNLASDSKQYLDQLVEFMRLQPDCTVKINGYTDNEGSKEYNQKLSEKRAASVMAYLASKGVDKTRLSSAGYGSDKPIDTNETPEGREKNRRVECEINWKEN
jgi:outer membrane protein OmpA-like peptidoglycan-associated protein